LSFQEGERAKTESQHARVHRQDCALIADARAIASGATELNC